MSETFVVNGVEYPQHPAGACYQYSRLLTLRRPELTYVEGVLVLDPLAMAHAWCEDPDGNVVDCTLSPENRQDAYPFYMPVRRGTDLTIAELDARGNPEDLIQEAAETMDHPGAIKLLTMLAWSTQMQREAGQIVKDFVEQVEIVANEGR